MDPSKHWELNKASTRTLPLAKNIRVKQTHSGKWYVASIFVWKQLQADPRVQLIQVSEKK